MVVLFVADAVSLPVGMASTQRLLALARGLRGAGTQVDIILLRPTEVSPQSSNRAATGRALNIPFEYACGTSFVPTRWLARRWLEFKGCLRGLAAIRQRARSCRNERLPLRVITYSRHLSTIVPVFCLCRALGVPLVAEMCEWPITQPDRMKLGRFRRRLFCRNVVRFIDGALPISGHIESVLAVEATRLGRPLRQMRIPILVDVGELASASNNRPVEDDYILFGGSAAYRKTIAFVLDVMVRLSSSHPALKLVLTGIDLAVNGWLVDEIAKRGLTGRVCLPGFIPRAELLSAYRQARALLIPLFDDDQSRARFPTKLAEYLLSGRPVITSRVGEIERHLEDGKNAFVAAPDRADLFAEKVAKAVDNPQWAALVGYEGKKTAEKEFDCSMHGRKLKKFLDSIAIL